MNFFGHAVIAGEYSADPEFILGSMLPDFLAMLRMPQPEVLSRELRDGVAFHHRTDAAFHSCSVFSGLQRQAFADLSRLGMRRGPARATAHVGIELLIDTSLADAVQHPYGDDDSKNSWSLYLAALEAGAAPGLAAAEDAERISQLCQRLAKLGRTRFEGGPEAAMEILRRAVRGRPRLELSSHEAGIAQKWSQRVYPSVTSQLEQLLLELKTELFGFAPGTNPNPTFVE